MGCIGCSCEHYVKFSGDIINSRIQMLKNFKGIMVVGESPTGQECAQGKVMSGAGAAVLKETLQKVGMPYADDEVYYTTAIKCAVPKKKGKKFPTDAPVNCRGFLLEEIRVVHPTLVLVCGATALQTLTGNVSIKVTQYYGRVLESKDYDATLKQLVSEHYTGAEPLSIMPIMNPGVLIHKPGDYKPFLSYMQLAATIYQGKETTDTGETIWEVCDTMDKCRDLYVKMRKANPSVVSFDLETTSLDYREAEVLVMGICWEKNHAYVIPREMILQNILHNYYDGVPWKCLWQNGTYDKKVAWRRGYGDISIDEDTILLHYALDETSSHDLGHLTKVYLNAAEYKYKMNQEWKNVEVETYPQYFEALCERVAVDVDYTLQLYHVLHRELYREGNESLVWVYENLLIPGSNFLTRVEENGCLINPYYLDTLDKKYVVELDNILKEISELAKPFWDPVAYKQKTGAKSAPATFNPGSPQQMAWMVFDRLQLKPRIKKGRSTGKDILNSIENPPKLIQKVLEYRTVQKEHSTYVIGLLKARDEDGRVRTNFTLHVTATGRLSSKEPNIQNQPSANGIGNIRRAFVAPHGHILAEIDYAGAELRWLAFMSRDPVLLKIFQEGRNLHKETATLMFGEHFTLQQKMIAKALNFGIAYGREAKSIADTFNISTAEAQGHIDNWFASYPGAHEYLEWCAHQVELGKYLQTPWGRRRRFGLVTPASLHSLQNEAKNFPIQSSSSDTLLHVCILHEKDLLDMKCKIINMIHDSALLEMPADPTIIKTVGKAMNEWMITEPITMFDCPVPFATDFEIGLNWGSLGGNVFDYNKDVDAADLIEVEQKDDSLKYYNWDDWYQEVKEKELM